jgi:hypothetical protein
MIVMRVAFFMALIGLFVANESRAQQSKVTRYTTPLAGTVELSKVEDKYDANVYSLEMPEPDADAEKIKLRAAKAESSRLFPRKSSPVKSKTTTLAAPVVSYGYVADSFPGIPPDNDMANSKGNISVSVVNSSIAIHDAASGQMFYRKKLYNFSLAVGLNNTISNQNNYRFDPKIIYDPEEDKYICVMLNGVNEYNHIVVGFSKTNRPDSTWYFYKFKGDYQPDTTWFDYPAINITHDELFFTGNKIKFNTSWQAGFTQSLIYQIDKQAGYNGDTALTYQIWDSIGYNGKSIRNLFPVKGGVSITGPEQYFLSNKNFDVQNDTIFLIKLPDSIGSGNTNLTVTPLVSNLTYGVPPDGRQRDTFTLATNDGRILGAYREGTEIQFVSTTVNPLNGNSGVYHGSIANFDTNPVVTANHLSSDSLDFGYPNISYAGAYGGANNSMISFDYTGPYDHAGMGAYYYDGTQYSPLVKVKTGDSLIKVQQDKQQRWGDYTGSQIDWNTTGVVWVEGIFGRKNRIYGNYIARLLSPFVAVNVPATGMQSSANTMLFPNPSFQYIRLAFELKQETKLSFYLYDQQGRKIDQLLLQHCNEGKNIIQFNTSSLAPGQYLLKGYNEKGSEVVTDRFIRN